MQAGRSLPSDGAQLFVEDHRHPAVTRPIEERAVRHVRFESLFEAHRLRAELHFVSEEILHAAAFELDGKRAHSGGRKWIFAQFDRIGPAHDAESFTTQDHAAHDPRAATKISARQIGSLVEDPSRRSCGIFLPDPLNMDERCLPLAVNEVLQAGQRHEIVSLARSRQEAISIVSTPDGGLLTVTS